MTIAAVQRAARVLIPGVFHRHVHRVVIGTNTGTLVRLDDEERPIRHQHRLRHNLGELGSRCGQELIHLTVGPQLKMRNRRRTIGLKLNYLAHEHEDFALVVLADVKTGPEFLA